MSAYKFTVKGKPIEIYPINTGKVAMKTRAHTIRYNNFGLRLIDIIKDKEFTNDLPIYCWLIKHPEGNFIIDTGYSSEINHPDYFKKGKALERWFTRTQVRASASKEDELVPQLKQLGIWPGQITAVILTHLHVDHVGGIPEMKGVRFLVNDIELKNNSQAFLLPEWFNPVKINLGHESVGTFPHAYPVTSSGDMHMVGTPGHSKGHCSVLLQTDEVDILFAGDVVYNADQLAANSISAPNDKKSSLDSYKSIKDYAKQRPLIVLPSHDERSVERLEDPLNHLVVA